MAARESRGALEIEQREAGRVEQSRYRWCVHIGDQEYGIDFACGKTTEIVDRSAGTEYPPSRN